MSDLPVQPSLRRLRQSDWIRRLVRETHLEPGQFLLPLFARPGRGVRRGPPAAP